jgi:transcription antitermination factor NusA-like protein
VRATLCNFCLKSGILCQKCQEKLKLGEVTETYLKVARLLISLENKYIPLQNVFLHDAIETNGVLALIVGRGDVARILSYGGKIVRELSEKTGKTIRVLEHGTEDRKFLEDLFAPFQIVTINTIWLPDGTTETRVILKSSRRKTPRIDINSLKEIARKIRGITLRVEFAS